MGKENNAAEKQQEGDPLDRDALTSSPDCVHHAVMLPFVLLCHSQRAALSVSLLTMAAITTDLPPAHAPPPPSPSLSPPPGSATLFKVRIPPGCLSATTKTQTAAQLLPWRQSVLDQEKS